MRIRGGGSAGGNAIGDLFPDLEVCRIRQGVFTVGSRTPRDGVGGGGLVAIPIDGDDSKRRDIARASHEDLHETHVTPRRAAIVGGRVEEDELVVLVGHQTFEEGNFGGVIEDVESDRGVPGESPFGIWAAVAAPRSINHDIVDLFSFQPTEGDPGFGPVRVNECDCRGIDPGSSPVDIVKIIVKGLVILALIRIRSPFSRPKTIPKTS